MKRKIAGNSIPAAAAVIIAAVAAFGLAGCEGKKQARQEPGGKFKLRAVTQTTFSETIIADRLGFFADEGIEIEYVGALGRGITQFQAIELGEIDVFTQGHLTSVGQARLAGIKVKAVSPGFVDDPDNPHVLYLVREDSPLRSLDDLPGSKVAASASVCTDGFLKRYLKERGIDYSTVEFINLSGQAGIAEQALVQGLIDVTTSHTPQGGIALAAGGVRKLASSWDIFHSPSAGLAVRGFSDKFIEEHPDIVQGFVNAEYRARVFMKKNPAYSRIVGGEYLELPADEVSSNSYDQNRNIDTQWALEWIKMSEDEGYWEKGQLAPDDIYTNAFVPRDIPASDEDIGREYLGKP
jgi:ABC-type nitrate/sulfonate/bicarbonate transport system substrate-binding protein